MTDSEFMGSIHAILDRFLDFPNCTYTPILVVGLDIMLQVSCVVDNLSRDAGEMEHCLDSQNIPTYIGSRLSVRTVANKRSS